MIKIVSVFVFYFCFSILCLNAKAQYVGPINGTAVGYAVSDRFSYLGFSPSNYGLGWYYDPNYNAQPTAYMSSYGGLKFFTAGQCRLMVDVNGNTGVGTTVLNAKFNVFQPIGLGSTARNYSLLSTVSGMSGTSNNVQHNIWMVRNEAGSDWGTTRLHDGISVDGFFTNPQIDTRTWWERDPSHDVQSWGTAGMTYLSIVSGKVGVNTSYIPDGYQFAINGKAMATSMTVRARDAWPDYVFDKDYEKQSLPDLEKFISVNHHLPEIPSAKEIEKDGIDLGGNQALLLKKIEELTLIVISQNKKIDNLTERLKKVETTK